jgi:hypothetical protein
MMTQKARQRLLLAVATIVALAVLAAHPLRHRILKSHATRNATSDAQVHLADDVSRLNATPVNEAWDIPSDQATAQSALRDLLKRARNAGLHVSIAGARQSMGGQTISPGGVRVNVLPLKSMELDERSDLLHVDAGALWADVIPYLDHHGRAVEVM